MRRPIFFITGTDTGVGKTVLGCLLTRWLRRAGVSVAALKPICSGGREDAVALHTAADAALTLDEVNPWRFRDPLAPMLAARREKRKLTLSRVVAHVRRVRKKFPVVIVEGAGGLLSPLGEDFDARDLIVSLHATPLVVCPNRLGAINQVRLALAALPWHFSKRARIVLTSPRRPDASSRSNPALLAEMFGEKRVYVLPRLSGPTLSVRRRSLRAFCRRLLA